jgi:hypothetical protein
MARTPNKYPLAILQETDPERLREISRLGAEALHRKYGNDTPFLIKARAVLAANRAARKAAREAAEAAEAQNGGEE